MHIRPIELSDIPRWIELRAKFWPRESPAELDAEGRAALNAEPPLVVFVAEGCTSSPVPYVEGW